MRTAPQSARPEAGRLSARRSIHSSWKSNVGVDGCGSRFGDGVALGAQDFAAQVALGQFHLGDDAAMDLVAHAVVELVDQRRRLVAGEHHHAAIRDDGAHVREELHQRARLGADELEIVEQDDLGAADQRAQVGRVFPLHAIDEGDGEVFRAHVEHAALAALRRAQRRLDAFQQVRFANAVRADNRHDVGRDATAHGKAMRARPKATRLESPTMKFSSVCSSVVDAFRTRLGAFGFVALFKPACRSSAGLGQRQHISGNTLARLDAHAAAGCGQPAPRPAG